MQGEQRTGDGETGKRGNEEAKELGARGKGIMNCELRIANFELIMNVEEVRIQDC